MITNGRFFCGVSLSVMSIVLGGAVALAAEPAANGGETPPAATAKAKKTDDFTTSASHDQGIEEVVVTAQRREQSAQNIGISLTTLSKEDLERRDVTNVNDIAKLAPSVLVEPAFGSGQPQFRIRGMGFNDYASNNSPTVGISVDQVAFPIPIMTQGQLFDLDRVEVLRGPQGTLYGRNTTAGAVNFLTANPTDVFTAGLTAEYSSLGEFKSEGYVSAPASDRFRIRISGATDQGGAWQTNRDTGASLGNKNSGALRVKTDWDATDDLNIKISAHYGVDDSENTGTYLIAPYKTPSGVILPADTNRKSTGWGISSQFAGVTGLSTTDKPHRDNNNFGSSIIVEKSFDSVKLTNISSYEGLTRRELDDWDATSVNSANVYFNSNANVFSNETRLSSNKPGPLQWIGGLYYSHEHLSDKFYDDFMSNYGFATETSYDQSAQTYSEFGQVEYNLTDSLKVIGGLRNEREDRKLTNFETKYATASVVAGTLDATSTAMNKVSGKVGVEYRVIQPVLVYGTVSRGVKSGGFSAYNTLSVDQLSPFKPEEVVSYETGFKSDLLGKRLRLNGSTFFENYKDQQVQSAIWNSTYGTIGKIVNAPKSELYGGELELDAEPIPGLQIGNGLGYARGKYTDFNDLDSPASSAAGHAISVDKSGRDLGFPKLTYVGSVAYTIHHHEYEITSGISYSYRGAQTSNWGSLYNVEPYWLVDAGLTLKPEEGNWAVTLYGKNILDKKYDVTRNYFTESAIGVAGEPASFGLRVKISY